MKDRSDDPSHHERTLSPRSYISLVSAIDSFSKTCKSDISDNENKLSALSTW